MASRTVRTTHDVFEDHLRLRQEGRLGEDLAENYAEDVVLLDESGIHRGHDGVRHLARRLRERLPDVTYIYRTRLVAGELAFLEWGAESPAGRVEDGADSFVIRDGRIVAQTIHYTVRPPSGS